jgi:hypothetical protein
MPFINQPPSMQSIFNDLNNRITKLENAVRFTAPDVTTEPTYPRVGDIIFDNTEDLMKYWNGTAWIEFADNNLGTSIVTTTNATLKTVNNNIVFTGQPLIIESQRIGKLLSAYAEIRGTTVTNWGTGQIYFQLPAGFPTFAHDVVAPGAITDNGNTYTIFGIITQGDNKMYLWSPTSNGGSDIVDHNSPTVLDATSVLVLNGVALIA